MPHNDDLTPNDTEDNMFFNAGGDAGVVGMNPGDTDVLDALMTDAQGFDEAAAAAAAASLDVDALDSVLNSDVNDMMNNPG